MDTKDKAQVFISFMSVVIASIVYFSGRKRYLLDVATQRAEIINRLFNETRKNTSIVPFGKDHYLKFWTDIVSEIIITKNVLEILAGKYSILKYLVSYHDIEYVFWEQMHTTIRMHFETFSKILSSDKLSLTIENKIFQNQVNEIIETYKKYFSKVES